MSRTVVFGIASLLTVFVVVLFALPYIKKYLGGVIQGFRDDEEDFVDRDEEDFVDREEEDFVDKDEEFRDEDDE